MGMAEQHEAAHNGKERQRDSPSRMGEPAEPPQEFYRADRKRKNAIGLVMKDFLIIAEERLREGKRPDGPGVVITPNEEKNSPYRQGTGKQEPGPDKSRPSQGLTHFAQSDQEKEQAG